MVSTIGHRQLNGSFSIRYSYIDKIGFFFYGLYFVLTPFYLFPSGLPQLADFIMLLAVVWFVLGSKLRLRYPAQAKKFLVVGLLFVLYVVVANAVWTPILTLTAMLRVSLFYVYNLVVSVTVVLMYGKYGLKMYEVTYNAILISIFTQFVLFVVGGGFTGRRMIAFFNNPNQLGYYSLMIASLMIFLSTKIPVRIGPFFLGLGAGLMLVFASLSTTAVVAYIGLLFLFFLSRSDDQRLKIAIIVIVVVVALLISIDYKTTRIVADSKMVSGLLDRFSGAETKLDRMETERGYNRIAQYPEYWIFGAGEGALWRFDARHEFHSTLGNIQLSYGILGTFLFLSYMYQSMKNDGFNTWYTIIMIMVYGLTHNGIRNSLLWILLALMVCSVPTPYLEKLSARDDA